MKFVCEKSIIIKEISIAHEIISSKNALSILSNVKLEAYDNKLVIQAKDIKVEFETVIPVFVEISGSTTVFCDKLLGILRTLPESDILFEKNEDEKLIIQPIDSKINFTLNSISADKFPELQSIEEDHYFEFSQEIFNNMISHTIFSISSDDARYFMNGVFLEKNDNHLIMVATDGRRLSYYKAEITSEIYDFKSIIIPPKILHLVQKLSSGEGNLSIAITEKTIYIKFDNQRITSTLIDGEFPNFTRVIPESQDYTIIIDRKKLNEALKRVSLLAEENSNRIFMIFKNDVLNLKSAENEIGSADEEIKCDYKGDEIKFGINFLYLKDPLKVIPHENLSIGFSGSGKPLTIKSEPEETFFHIIMPMQ